MPMVRVSERAKLRLDEMGEAEDLPASAILTLAVAERYERFQSKAAGATVAAAKVVVAKAKAEPKPVQTAAEKEYAAYRKRVRDGTGTRADFARDQQEAEEAFIKKWGIYPDARKIEYVDSVIGYRPKPEYMLTPENAERRAQAVIEHNRAMREWLAACNAHDIAKADHAEMVDAMADVDFMEKASLKIRWSIDNPAPKRPAPLPDDLA